MAQATYAVPSVLGGELSKFAQGRFDKPDYKISLKTCLNSFPLEIGAWTRRPGTQFAGATRRGLPGRVIEFDFQQSAPVTLEFTDGNLRFRAGANLVTINPLSVLGISAANPAVVTVPAAYSTGTAAIFLNAPGNCPALINRRFLVTKIDSTHVSLQDEITGANIDGSALGFIGGGMALAGVHELITPYIGGSWASIRAVQAETTQILLAPTVAPQALTVTTKPSPGINPQFALAPAVFNDGPYLDPPINGVQVTPGATSGLVTFTLNFPTWDTTKAYAQGAFVTLSGTNYKSLVDQNVGQPPASNPLDWAPTSAGAAINNGQGFLGTDVGRLVRLFSEPALWLVGSTYAIGARVAYNPSGLPGASTYWQSLTAGNIGNAPGSDLTNWQIIPQGAAIWTWGKITGLSSVINPAPSGAANIGDMTGGGGLAAAFDGVFSQAAGASAEASTSIVLESAITFSSFVGKNYTGASNQKIASATVYPSNDTGLVSLVSLGPAPGRTISITLNLRANASAPGSASDGTLLGSSGAISNRFSAVGITSNDQSTAWAYVWIEMIVSVGASPFGSSAYTLSNAIAELSLFNPAGTGTGAGCTVEILGPPLLSTTSIRTWRFGVYSNTTGWPTCGVYNDGRLYLGGAVGNRLDACVSNGIVGAAVNFAPTDQYGAVAPASAISYVFNSDGVNPILWMVPDLQGIKCGTQAGEWLIQAPTAGSIAPNNITARNVTDHGSANIQPCRTEHTTIFVQRYARKLLEYFPDVYSGKFSAPNLADKAEHLTAAGVAELAYTSAVTPIIWGRDTAGALFGITYKRDSLASSQPPTFYGWHRHALGSGRIIESICSGPSVGGNLDALTMVTNDPLTNIRHVEILTDTPNELSPLSAAWFLDDAVQSPFVVPAVTGGVGYGGATIYGLAHLNGKTVQIFAGGLDCGDQGEGKPFVDFVVTNGSTFVPFGDGISAGSGRGLFTSDFLLSFPGGSCPVVVGFTYNSDGQLVRPISPADTGARNGPAFAKLSRGHRFGMALVNALGLLIGGDLTKKMYPALFKTPGNNPIPALTTFTGVHQDSLNDDYGYENGAPAWRVSRPFPATITIISTNLATADQ